jgi:hypothetical protein
MADTDIQFADTDISVSLSVSVEYILVKPYRLGLAIFINYHNFLLDYLNELTRYNKFIFDELNLSVLPLRGGLAFKKIPLAPMGVLAPGFAQARPSTQPPIDTSGNFPAPVSAESPSNISPNPSEIISEVSEP